jgi:hypothetical protein
MNVTQVYTNPGRQVAQAKKIGSVALNVCGSLVWNLFRVHLSGAHNVAMTSGFLNVCAPLTFRVISEFLSVSDRLFERALGTKKCQILKWKHP